MKDKIIEFIRARLLEKSTKVALAGMLLAALGGGAEFLEASDAITGGVVGLLLALFPTSKAPPGTLKSPAMSGVAAIMLTLLLSACGQNFSVLGGYLAEVDDPQNMAGVVKIEYKFCENSGGAFEVCGAVIWDVKEQANVEIDWEIDQDGKLAVKYTATDTSAFPGILARAEVQTELGKALGGKVLDTLQSAINPAGVLASPDVNPD